MRKNIGLTFTHTDKPTDERFIDRVGHVYGRWTVARYLGRIKRLKYWECVCSCGEVSAQCSANLTSGRSTSCGCAKDDVFRFGEEPTSVEGARWVQLTKGGWALVDDEDFDKVSKFKWYLDTGGYAASDSSPIRNMHNFIIGTSGGMKGDHKDGNRLNNRKGNLREATSQQNSWNQSIRKTNTSGFKGVSLVKKLGKWRARIKVDGKERHLGLFSTKEEAYSAYVIAGRAAFGEFFKAA